MRNSSTPTPSLVHLAVMLIVLIVASCGNTSKTSDSKTTETSTIFHYEEAKEQLSQAEKVGQLFMPAAYINDSEEDIQAIEKLIREKNVGALCFFHSRISTAANFGSKKAAVVNSNSFEKLKELIIRYQKASKYPLLIAIDAEWGLAMRVENTPQYPYAITLGAMQNKTDLVYEVGRNMAVDLNKAGIHWNLAPVVDVNNNPKNPVIGFRSFGENRQTVAENAIAFNKGLKSNGILGCAKHFPGHGDTATDSHLGLPVIDKSKEALFATELYPFGELIKNDVDAVMIGHLSVPALANGSKVPATLSKEIIQNILRKELAFKNVVISDALNMKSVSKMYPIKGELEWVAFDAGNDILCFAENTTEGISTILEKATTAQIELSFKRIWNLKEKAFASDVNTSKPTFTKEELNAKVAAESLSIYKGDDAQIRDFRNQKFAAIEFNKTVKNKFFKSLADQSKIYTYSASADSLASLKASLKNEKNVLITLFPPQVRTKNKFGISDEELNFINTLALEKNVVLYVFGNPFVLNHLDTGKIETIVLAYQNFRVFQENAKQHFLGKTKAKGKLPVTL